MPLNKFEEHTEHIQDHNDFAQYINQVKQEAEGTDYHGAVRHELTRATQFVFNQLTATTDPTHIVLLTGELRGLQMASRYIDSLWPIDKDEEKETEE